MTAADDPRYEIARQFHAALTAANWDKLRSVLHDDATWWLPGDNAISGKAIGADAVVARAQKIASYGLSFELLHILVSPTNMAPISSQHRPQGRRGAGRIPGNRVFPPQRQNRQHRNISVRRARHLNAFFV